MSSADCISHVVFFSFFFVMNCTCGYVFGSLYWYSFSFDSSNIGDQCSNMSFTFDSIWCSFSLLLFFTTLLVVYFCFHYYGSDSLEGMELCCLLVVFSGIVWVLTASSCLLVTLVWWDYLGIVSFFLVLRNSNKDSVFSSLVVVLCSRVGDVGLFCLVGIYYYNSLLDNWSSGLVDLLVVLVVFSKSAVYPFSPWLIEAMRAATAVSSLVHSATLVTAGVWFVSRYGGVLAFSTEFNLLITSMILVTIYFSALMAATCLDLKKIVAFSTCNNMSWCLLFCMFGYYEASLCQLFVHGVLKCICFVYMGCCMSNNSSVQLWEMFYSYSGSNREFICILLVLVGLGGFPCYGTYFMKHFLLNLSLQGNGVVLTWVVWLGSLMTAGYIGRMISMVINIGDQSRSFSWGSIFVYWLVFISICLILDEIISFLGVNGEGELSFGYSGSGVSMLVWQLFIGLISCGVLVCTNGYLSSIVSSIGGIQYVFNVFRSIGWVWSFCSSIYLILFEYVVIFVYRFGIGNCSWCITIGWFLNVVFFIGGCWVVILLLS